MGTIPVGVKNDTALTTATTGWNWEVVYRGNCGQNATMYDLFPGMTDDTYVMLACISGAEPKHELIDFENYDVGILTLPTISGNSSTPGIFMSDPLYYDIGAWSIVDNFGKKIQIDSVNNINPNSYNLTYYTFLNKMYPPCEFSFYIKLSGVWCGINIGEKAISSNFINVGFDKASNVLYCYGPNSFERYFEPSYSIFEKQQKIKILLIDKTHFNIYLNDILIINDVIETINFIQAFSIESDGGGDTIDNIEIKELAVTQYSPNLDVLACAKLSDVLTVTDNSSPHVANGVNWYYNNSAMGFAGSGDSIYQQCGADVGDIANINYGLRDDTIDTFNYSNPTKYELFANLSNPIFYPPESIILNDTSVLINVLSGMTLNNPFYEYNLGHEINISSNTSFLAEGEFNIKSNSNPTAIPDEYIGGSCPIILENCPIDGNYRIFPNLGVEWDKYNNNNNPEMYIYTYATGGAYADNYNYGICFLEFNKDYWWRFILDRDEGTYGTAHFYLYNDGNRTQEIYHGTLPLLEKVLYKKIWLISSWTFKNCEINHETRNFIARRYYVEDYKKKNAERDRLSWLNEGLNYSSGGFRSGTNLNLNKPNSNWDRLVLKYKG